MGSRDAHVSAGGSRAPWRGRAILHVDMDAFFASVEQLDHPEWHGLPVVVGGSPGSRGVIAAASYEARRYGVRSAMPSAQAARLLPPEAVWTRGDFARYGEMSQRVFQVFESFTPDVQAASIDEAYLDVTPAAGGFHPIDVAIDIQSAVDAIGLSCSIGVASNRTVAKIASDRDKPHGITVVAPGDEATFLAPLPVRTMPGVGPTTARRLVALGVTTLGDLAALDDGTAAQVLGSHGPTAVRRARGIDARPVQERASARSISNERTFASDIRAREDVLSAIAGLAERVGTRVRRAGLHARTIHLKVRFGDFTTRTAQQTLAGPTDSTDALLACATGLLESIWAPGAGIRLLGIGVSGFGSEPTQLAIEEVTAAADRRRVVIERAVDELRERFGPDSIRFGTRGSTATDSRERYGPG
jgi:DNA polymerase-4